MRYVPKGIDYKFPRPVPGRLQLENNWCLQEARLLDPNDEEDPIRILRRFKELHGDWKTEGEVRRGRQAGEDPRCASDYTDQGDQAPPKRCEARVSRPAGPSAAGCIDLPVQG